jgi:GntR family transcriptional regulator
MQLIVSPSDDLPIYRQIMRQVVEAIATGRLAPGAQLPSHRDLSEQLVIAPLTVKKAYDELESAGYIETQRGRGTFVSARSAKSAQRAQSEHIAATARALVAQAYGAGLTLDDVIRAVKSADRELPSTNRRNRESA